MASDILERFCAKRVSRCIALALALSVAGLAAPPSSAAQSAAQRSAQAASPSAFLKTLEQARARSAAKDWPAAAALWEQVVAANPVEGGFWTSLATARYAAKDYRGAIAAYQKSVALGAGSPEISAYNIACAYALLGEPDPAFAWLERALALRFLDLDLLRTDTDLASLRGDPRLARLIPIADVSGLSLEQGWRHDLRFLAWQIDRLGADPYRRKPKAWFEAEFDKLAASAPRRNETQMAFELAKIVREVGDGHSYVSGGGGSAALTLPVQFHPFEDGVFVIAADPKHKDLLGAEVLRFAGRPVADVLDDIGKGVSRDNDGGWVELQASYRLRHTALLQAAGLITERGGATLEVRALDGRRRTVRLPEDATQPDIWNKKPSPPEWATLGATLPGPAPLHLRNPGKPYWFEHLAAQRTVYFGFNSVRNDKAEPITAFSDRLAEFLAANPVDKLVIDLRWNNGGDTALVTPVLAAVLRSPKINRRGRLFVLVGRRTFSAAQNAATLLERFTNATFVGEPTGSSPNFIGEEDAFVLPYSKVRVNISHLAWQSGYPQDRRTWIAPLIYVPPTFADYRAQRDRALEAVLSFPVPE